MKPILFFLVLLSFIDLTYEQTQKQICTDAFGLNEKYNKCWRPMQLRWSNADADEQCRQLSGSTLAAVDSLKENQALQAYLADLLYREVWIGLYCNASDVGSCYWSHERGKVQLTYMDSPFQKGSPNVTTGNCVVYSVKDGTWFSRNCSQVTEFFCELPPTTQDDCTNNYDHHCYTINQTAKSFADAQKSCQQNCGNLASIHSELENRYVSSIFSTPGFTSLGGIAPSKNTILWSDDSIQVYNRISNFTTGNCVFMNVNTTDDTNGMWFSDLCSKPSQYICKRPTGVKCGA